MSSSDFNKPVVGDTYTSVLSEIRASMADLAVGLRSDIATPANTPTGAVRWNYNSGNPYLETWSGSAWGIWATSNIYSISINGNAATATTATNVAWSGVTSKPTTCAGFSLTGSDIASTLNGQSITLGATTTGALNATGAITQSGSQVLTAANFTSYVPGSAYRRQSVNTGIANFIQRSSGVIYNLYATTSPVSMSFSNRANCYITTLFADVAGVFTLPNDGAYYYVSANYVSATSVTWAWTKAPPQYGPSYDPSCQLLMNFDVGIWDDFGNSWSAVGGARTQNTQVKFGTNALGGSGASNALNGTTDYISTPSPWSSLYPQGAQSFVAAPAAASFSIRAWVYLTALPGSGQRAYLFRSTSGGTYGLSICVYNNGTNIRWQFQISNDGSTWWSQPTGVTNVTTGAWHFVEFTYQADATPYYFLYLDGALEISLASSNTYLCGVTDMRIGYTMQGYIDAFEYLPYCYHPNGTTYSVPVSAPSITTSGYASDWFDTNNMVMNQVSGIAPSTYQPPAMTAVNRLYCVETKSGFAPTVYALNGRNSISNTYSWSSGTSLGQQLHNLGTPSPTVSVKLVCVQPNNGYYTGSTIDVTNLWTANGTTSYGLFMSYDKCYFNATYAVTGGFYLPGNVAVPGSSWNLRFDFDRGW
jgi:hypothetical protein